MPLMSIAGGSLFAERIGAGVPRVLALHGWGRRGADFLPSLDGLDALAVDLPGFGASPPPSEPMGAAGYAELIRPVFELFEPPPVVVGHSFGGRVAVVGQARGITVASGLVLIASPLLRREQLTRRPAVRYRAARLAHRMGIVGDTRMEALRNRYGSADYRAVRGVMRDVLVTTVNESYETELKGLGVPVHLLWGADDSEVPVRTAERARDVIEAAGEPVELEIIDGVGHHPPLQAPQSVHRAVAAMLERVSP